MNTSIYYDGDCPFCSDYVGFTRLRDAAGQVDLVDLRTDAAARDRFLAQGADPDQGMIVETGGQVYHGADAMHVLSLMSSGQGLRNAAAAALFRHKTLARAFYPMLRMGRNAVVTAMGATPLTARDAAREAQYLIFARFLGLFATLHVFYYLFRGAPGDVQPTAPVLFALGLGLIVVPGARALFIGLIAALALDGWLHAPTHSNHTMLLNFFVVTVIAAGGWHAWRGSPWDRFFADIRPVGRCLLLIMYTFGIFHKINTGFLNPEVSCAVVLWREMPAPLVWIDTAPMHYLAIYGTFAVEAVIMAMLILPRFRHWGICAGIGFHGLLALSGYAMYPVFSTLAIVLHTLFISPASAQAVTQSARWQGLDRALRSLPGAGLLLTGLAGIAFFAMQRDYTQVALIWMALVAWPLILLATKGAADPESDRTGAQFAAPLMVLNVIPVLFFLNAISPYLGLKNAQSMNMFANLRLEGGVSNHLVLPGAPGPFAYLSDVVEVTGIDGQPLIVRGYEDVRMGLVFSDFMALARGLDPATEVSFLRNGTAMGPMSAAEVLATQTGPQVPGWASRFVHFHPVILDRPRPC